MERPCRDYSCEQQRHRIDQEEPQPGVDQPGEPVRGKADPRRVFERVGNRVTGRRICVRDRLYIEAALIVQILEIGEAPVPLGHSGSHLLETEQL